MNNYTEKDSKAYLYGICAVAVIGGLLFGYDTAVISGAEQALQEFFISGLGMAIGMNALSILSFQNVIGIAALVFIIVYTASFMMSWRPICWVLISEICPNTIRRNAVAIAVAAKWVSNYVISSHYLHYAIEA